MTKMFVDVVKKEIRISKAAYTIACRVGTHEYFELQQILREHPTFELHVEERKTSNDPFKFLNFAYMEKYIVSHDDPAGSIMKEYRDLRGLSDEAKEMGAVTYTLPQMKEWFLEKFPEVRDYHKKRTETRQKLSEQRKAAMTRKAA